MTKHLFAILLLLWPVSSLAQSPTTAPKPEQVSIPATACTGAEQFPRGTAPTPLPPPALPASGTIQLTLPPAIAAKLAAYILENARSQPEALPNTSSTDC